MHAVHFLFDAYQQRVKFLKGEPMNSDYHVVHQVARLIRMKRLKGKHEYPSEKLQL